MEIYRFTIPGHAIPKQRMTQHGKWTPRAKRSLEFQRMVAWYAKAARLPELTGDLALGARIYFSNRRHGDLSNIIKAIEDGLQYAGIIRNDRQILRYENGTGIYYGKPERVEVSLRELAG